MVYDRRNDCSYLCLNNSFARIAADSTGLYKSRQKPSLWVSGFSASDEQTGERIQLPVSGTDEIASAFNNISISLAYPVYNDFALNVRYRLEGLSASGKWTEGLPDLQKEFTRLPFGSYCFRAEVYDENGVISSFVSGCRCLCAFRAGLAAGAALWSLRIHQEEKRCRH